MMLTCSKGTLDILAVALQHRAKILFSSSAEIYGQPEKSPQVEHYNGNVAPIGPRSAYEEGKRFAESVVKLYTDKYGINA